MSDDPIKDLFDTEGFAVTPLAPSEVRRRGDQLRRRRNVAGVVAGVAAVALIATPIALLGGGDDSSSPVPPIDTPTPTSTQTDEPPVQTEEIPDGFPLAVNWPDDDAAETEEMGLAGPNRRLDPVLPTACGVPFEDHAYVDRLRANWTNVEDYRVRQLTTFESASRAADYVQDLRNFWNDCPSYDGSDDGYTSFNVVWSLDAGTDSAGLVTYYEFDGAQAVGLTTYAVLRVGRAVLIDGASNEGGAGPDREGDITRNLQGQVDATAPIVEAMCLFTEAGCGGAGSDALSPADLIAPEETQPRYETAWEIRDTYAGEGEDTSNPCFTNTLEGRGATAVFRRDFEMHGPQGVTEGDWMTAVVAEFPDRQTAQAAFIGFGEDSGLCEARIVPEVAEEYSLDQVSEVVLTKVDGEARVYSATYGPWQGNLDAVYRMETGVAWVGKRLVLLTTVAGPYEPVEFPSPTAMEAMLVQAAERLAPGPEGPITPPTLMI